MRSHSSPADDDSALIKSGGRVSAILDEVARGLAAIRERRLRVVGPDSGFAVQVRVTDRRRRSGSTQAAG